MMLSPNDAASALSEIDSAQTRSATLHGYARSSPHLILWGVLWAIGYGLNDLFPAYGGAIWAVVILIGLIGDLSLLRHERAGAGWRYGVVALTLIAFFFAVFAIMTPVSGRQIAAVIALAVGAGYVLAGIWQGPRLVVAGLVVAGLTLAGFFLVSAHFYLWMAGVGGASLVLAGLWLKRV